MKQKEVTVLAIDIAKAIINHPSLVSMEEAEKESVIGEALLLAMQMAIGSSASAIIISRSIPSLNR
jgi:hypothetical protein